MPLKAEGEFAPVKQKLENALKLSGQPVKRGTMAHEHIMYMMLVDSAVQARDEATLQKYIPLLEKLALRDNHKPYLAVAHRAWGVAHRMAGEFTQAKSRLEQALELFNAQVMHWQVGRTYFEMAELDLAQSDQASARDHFSQALTAFQAMKASPAIARTNTALQTLG